MKDIRELLIEEMKDLYDAEKQLVKALPKMVKASSNEELSQAFEEHLEQTRGHVTRLETAFERMGERPKSKPCEAMKGLIQEAQETLEEEMPEALMDSAIICAAQKVEHYEIASYGTLSAWAKQIGLDDVAELFDETLEEEKTADETLTEVNGTILAGVEGMESEEADTEAEGVTRKGPSGKQNAESKPGRRAG